MQITVVEIPIGQTLSATETPSDISCSSTDSWHPGLVKAGTAHASGLWYRSSSADSPRSSGVFPAVRPVGNWASANDVWRWVPPSSSEEAPEGCLRLVVFQRGATWPPVLARDLSGGVTTCIVPEVLGDGLSGLVQRVSRRAQQMNMPVTQLVWISPETRRSAPLRFVRQLADAVNATTTVMVVQASQVTSRRRAGRRRREGTAVPPAESDGRALLASAVGAR